ncbi:MAG: M48 family metallopeptidase [Blastocatellia bacterium]
MRSFAPVFALFVLLAFSANAQPPINSAASTPSVTAATQAGATSAPAQGRVAIPEPDEKTMRYYHTGIGWWIFSTLWGLAIPALFLFTGLSARLRTLAQGIGRKWLIVVGVYFALFAVLSFAIDLVPAYFQDFARQHEYGLSNQTMGKWLGDGLKGLMVSVITGFLFLWIPYLLLRKSPTHWWLWTGLLSVPFVILGILIAPVWIDPLFNKFGPMKNKQLETKILQLADRSGIEGSRVYEVAKSEDTKMLNAYVTGFGGTKRIVLWDTAIARLDEPELLSVMGHEMGHYVLGHVWKTILFLSALIILTLYAIHRTAGWLIDRYRQRFGFSQIADVASLPLLILLFGLYGFIASPVVNAWSRYQEHESDRFGLEIMQNNHAAASAFAKLQTENLANPRPHWLLKIMRASHPPLGERIDFCNEYRPWEKNEPLVYGHLFRQPGGKTISANKP